MWNEALELDHLKEKNLFLEIQLDNALGRVNDCNLRASSLGKALAASDSISDSLQKDAWRLLDQLAAEKSYSMKLKRNGILGWVIGGVAVVVSWAIIIAVLVTK
jgi:hypothetical protein